MGGAGGSDLNGDGMEEGMGGRVKGGCELEEEGKEGGGETHGRAAVAFCGWRSHLVGAASRRRG